MKTAKILKRVLLWACVLGAAAGAGAIGFGGSDRPAAQEYRRITTAGLKGQALFEQLRAFEAQHPAHFESKVDLGNFFVLTGDYERAAEYLARAESVLKNCGTDATGKEHKQVFFYCMALVAGSTDKPEDALAWLEKASAVGDEGAYWYLKAALLADRGDKDAAIAQYEAALAQHPEALTAKALRALTDLYADAGRYEEAATTLDSFYDLGTYDPGFGDWASGVYEKAGQPGKSLLAAWLDLDYVHSQGVVDEAFMKLRLDQAEAYLREKGLWDQAGDDVYLARAAFGFAPAPTVGSPKRDYSFLRSYVLMRGRLAGGHYTDPGLFDDLQDMEGFFLHCPNYYALVWETAAALGAENKAKYASCLEKAITMGAEPALDRRMRVSLGDTIGLNPAQSARLLLLTETSAVLEHYRDTRKDADLDRFFGLLDLPDNAYVLSALVLAKQNRPLLQDALLAHKTGATPRQKERIEFLLQ
jgi:tetratricopeptide (TPR) repeat protein